MSIRQVLDRSLNTQVSPMVYVMMFVSGVYGVCFALFDTIFPDVHASLLFQNTSFIDVRIWGLILAIGSFVALAGLFVKNRSLIRAGSLLSFMMWMFATITCIFNGLYFILVGQALFHLVFQAYVYLATALGYIFRRVDLD